MAVDIITDAGKFRWPSGDPIVVRGGIATGPAVAGVIGDRGSPYDLWGDTVNLASRLETNAEPGRFLVSESTARSEYRVYFLVPLVAKDRVLGVVAIPSIGAQKKYTSHEVQFCQSIADVTATSLSNAYYAENLDSSVKERTIELQQANFKLKELVRELQYLNDLKNDFISSLSHELRTPITAIKGSIDIMKKGILGELKSC